ncbi:glutamate--cysteine ligase, partial [Streptosporangium algeriense]
WGVDARVRDRLLTIVERRCVTGRTGARWQTGTVAALETLDGLDRHEALRRMTLRYIEHMHTNEPVHTWPLT